MTWLLSAKTFARAFGRVFTRCGTVTQAIAFNMFLAFFPTLLIAVGVATSPFGSKTGLLDFIRHLTAYLPPGSQQVVGEYLVRRAPNAWRWAVFGWAGTLLAGSQVMKLVMEGIHLLHGDPDRLPFLRRQLRGFALLCVTIAPLLVAAVVGVFGRPLRLWILREFGRSAVVRSLLSIVFPLAAMLLAMAALTVIYRVARREASTWRGVLPGAAFATFLWWIVNLLFGIYVRRVPYGMVYGGLAAAIGLMVWMQLSAFVVLFGAAWNAEFALRPR
jgi:membrane protein